VEIRDKISNTLKERFKDKECHPRYGKTITNESKDKISKSLINYFKENKKIVSDETKEKMSISAKNKKFIIRIKEIETNNILTFNNTNELREFITNFKIEKGIGKTQPPSYNLLISGKNKKFFILLDKYHVKK